MPSDSRVYWAAEPDSKQVVEKCWKRIRNYRDWLASTGRQEKMLRAWHTFYGDGPDGMKSTHKLLRGGMQGELVLTSPNLYAVLIRQTARLISGQKAALKAIAVNSDAESVAEVVLAEALLDYYDRKALLQEADNDATLSGLILSSGWVVYSWATDLGEEIGVADDGRVVREGDVRVNSLLPWDVAVDARDSEMGRQWVAFRRPFKRHDLATQYPHVAEEVLLAKANENLGEAAYPFDDANRSWRIDDKVEDEDNVFVWELRHLRTPACPNGRLLRFVNAECILYDSGAVKAANPDGGETSFDAGYPYPELLAYEFCPERQVGRAGGHSAHFDTISMQELLDLIVTTVTSNVNIGGMLNIWSPQEPNLSRLSTGFNVISSSVKPEVIDLLKIPPEMMAFAGAVREWMQTLAGQNDVTMGTPDKGMPAQMAALLEAKAVQYHQQGQAAYYRLIERSRTGLLKLLARFAKGDRVAQLVGKSGQWAMTHWTGDDIASVERVSIEPVNPVMKTFAGKVQLADSLAEKFGIVGNQPMTRDEYLAVYTTGTLTQTFDAPKAHLGRLAKEKELLMQGIGLPPVDMQASMQTGEPQFVGDDGSGKTYIRPLLTDRHWLDIPEYLALLESPETRSNTKVVQAVTDLVQEHLRLWRSMPPDLVMLLGGPMPPPMPGMGGPPPPPNAGPPPPGGKSDVAEMASMKGAPDVKMPAPPPNPVTGEQPPPVPVGGPVA